MMPITISLLMFAWPRRHFYRIFVLKIFCKDNKIQFVLEKNMMTPYMLVPDL